MQEYAQSNASKSRTPGKRRCDRCQRWYKPLNECVRFCGCCSARLLSLAARGWR
jgi:hypothetical protein